MTPPAMSGPRFNEYINVPKVRVIDENGENLGVMFTKEAIEQAAEVGLDLVEISPGADPPVAKFLDIGRYKYEAQKKANEQRKKQKTQEIKEIKMRPNIDDHDYDVKMKKVVSFIERGRQGQGHFALPRPRAGARPVGHGAARAGPGRRCRHRQGRAASAHGRPPDADGDRAQVRRTASGDGRALHSEAQLLLRGKAFWGFVVMNCPQADVTEPRPFWRRATDCCILVARLRNYRDA